MQLYQSFFVFPDADNEHLFSRFTYCPDVFSAMSLFLILCFFSGLLFHFCLLQSYRWGAVRGHRCQGVLQRSRCQVGAQICLSLPNRFGVNPVYSTLGHNGIFKQMFSSYNTISKQIIKLHDLTLISAVVCTTYTNKYTTTQSTNQRKCAAFDMPLCQKTFLVLPLFFGFGSVFFPHIFPSC